MYKSLLQHGRVPILFGATGFFELFSNPDAIDKDMRTAKNIKLPQEETGRDRLNHMFSYDEYGYMSPELSQVVQGVMLGTFAGTLIGGTNHSKENYINFMKQNQATAFQSHFEAKRQLQNKVTLGFARGAWMWGWRLGVFTGSFIFLTTTISVYRGKSSLLEYIVAGGITGFTYKFKQGPRAWVIGGGLGSVLGAVCGSLSLGLMWLTGTTMEEVRFGQYQWKAQQQKEHIEKMKSIRAEELDPLTLNYAEKMKRIRAEELDHLTLNHAEIVKSTSLDILDIAKGENEEQKNISQGNIKMNLEQCDNDIIKQ